MAFETPFGYETGAIWAEVNDGYLVTWDDGYEDDINADPYSADELIPEDQATT